MVLSTPLHLGYSLVASLHTTTICGVNVSRKGVWLVHGSISTGRRNSFCRRVGGLKQVQGPHKFQGVSNLENVCII